MKKLFAFILILFLIGCKQAKEHPIDFYYWRSNYQLSNTEKQTIKDLKVKNLYVRFFDVDKKEINPKPIGTIKKFNSSLIQVNYIPTVFITNRTFIGLKPEEVKKIASNVHQLINQIASSGGLKTFHEIQIDCDWTKNTRENYFLFLTELKKVSNKNLSATLRLHQVKFKEKEGVPPLDKMVMMCYATENPNEVDEKNSILDLPLAKDYLANLQDYPLKLDVALPIYSWAIITNHLGQIKLINSFTEEQLINKPVKSLGYGKYEVVNDFFLENFYLSKGFKIKVETISPNLLEETKIFLDSKLTNDFRIIYFHLDDQFLTNYNFTKK